MYYNHIKKLITVLSYLAKVIDFFIPNNKLATDYINSKEHKYKLLRKETKKKLKRLRQYYNQTEENLTSYIIKEKYGEIDSNLKAMKLLYNELPKPYVLG